MSHILYVEDNDTLRQVTHNALLKRGFKVTALSSFSQAHEHIQLFCANKSAPVYDAAILDLKLQNQLSLPLIPLLRTQQPSIKIVVLTGYASIASAVEAVKLGADNYLPKPAHLNDVLAAVSLNKEPCAQSNTASPIAHHQQTLSLNNQANTATIVSTQRLEWEHIQRVLLKNAGNISAAARELNMHRRTLQRKLQKYPHKQ